MCKRFNPIIVFSILLIFAFSISCEEDDSVEEVEEQELEVIAEGLQFAEGPAYVNNNLYFSDIAANKIYKWNENIGSQIYLNNSGAANGIYPDKSGKMIVCQGGNKQLISIDANQNISVLTDEFNDIPYNEPNDVWISPNGNIYFTDPVYTGTLSQPGEYVYSVLSSSGEVIKVADDLTRPNGIIGTPDGSKLYIADHGDSKIYQYTISGNGHLSNKKLFAAIQADGLSIDTDGNLYAASKSIMIYNSSGTLIKTIDIPGTITNICVTEGEKKTAFITTHNKVYKQIIHEL